MAYLYKFDNDYVSDEDSDYSYESDGDDDSEYISDTDSFINEEENDLMIMESSFEPIGIPTHIRVKKPYWYNRPIRVRKQPVRYQA